MRIQPASLRKRRRVAAVRVRGCGVARNVSATRFVRTRASEHAARNSRASYGFRTKELNT